MSSEKFGSSTRRQRAAEKPTRSQEVLQLIKTWLFKFMDEGKYQVWEKGLRSARLGIRRPPLFISTLVRLVVLRTHLSALRRASNFKKVTAPFETHLFDFKSLWSPTLLY